VVKLFINKIALGTIVLHILSVRTSAILDLGSNPVPHCKLRKFVNIGLFIFCKALNPAPYVMDFAPKSVCRQPEPAVWAYSAPQTPLAGLGGEDGARGGKEWEGIRDNGEQGFIYIALGGYTPPVVW